MSLAQQVRKLFGIRLGVLGTHSPTAVKYSKPQLSHVPDEHLPRISVVTPSFNQGNFISATMNSVLNQGYPNLDYVIQDSCSTDQTPEVLRNYEGKGCRVYVEKDSGQADGINKGFARSDGEVMAYLNSDDLLLPNSLLSIGRIFRDHPEVDVVYGDRLLINEDGNQVGTWRLPYHDSKVLRLVDYIPQETLFWRRSMFERVGGAMNNQFQFALDWDLLLRFERHKAQFKLVPQALGAFRVHSAQKTSAAFRTVGHKEISQLRHAAFSSTWARLRARPSLWKFLLAHWWVEHVSDNRG